MDTELVITPVEHEFLKKWTGPQYCILGVWVYGSRLAVGVEQAGDLDVLFILDGEPQDSWLKELKVVCNQFREAFDTILDPLVISLPTLWYKLSQGDVQLLTIITESIPLIDPGLLRILSHLLQSGFLKPDPKQMSALLTFAQKNLDLAKDERRLPIRRLVSLRTAARSVIQALCLHEQMLPPPPRLFPGIIEHHWLEELGIDVIMKYQEFEQVMSAASRQRATTSDVVVEWAPYITRLVTQGTAVCHQTATTLAL